MSGRSDFAGYLRGLPQRSQGATEDRDVGDQQHQEDGERDPSDIPVEVGDDIVDYHVAVGQILAGLDPDGLVADGLLDAGAGYGGVAVPLLQECEIVRWRVRRKLRCVVFQRGKQHAPAFVDHGIGITPVGLRIEPEQVERQVEFELAVGMRDQMLPDRDGLFLHRLVMNVVGRIVQQPRQRERHENRGDGDGDDVKDHDA